MKKIWRTALAIAVIIIMTYFGVILMENEWCESMSGLIWIVGEIQIVGILMWKDVMAFYKKLF